MQIYYVTKISKLFSYLLVADRASFVYLPQWETPYGTPQAGDNNTFYRVVTYASYNKKSAPSWMFGDQE